MRRQRIHRRFGPTTVTLGPPSFNVNPGVPIRQVFPTPTLAPGPPGYNPGGTVRPVAPGGVRTAPPTGAALGVNPGGTMIPAPVVPPSTAPGGYTVPIMP